ncbi:biotin/lipoyl-binding protein [Leptolyngbya sp. 15MV]|nr:biotin/lipoyl-binding protein [Leptolyngbya sp. 15MV]
MPTPIKMPALSPTMEEGTLARWLVKEGDTVSSGDIMAEIETDKATMEFEAVDEGVIAKWKCMVPFGSPVEPEVKPMRQTSSAALSCARNCGAAAAQRASSAPSPQVRRWRRSGASALRSSSTSRASQSAWVMRALRHIWPSSFARSSGMVATTTPPAFSTAK